MMKQIFFAMVAATVFLTGLTGCSKNDNPATADVSALEKGLVGLWWDEYEYADITETGVPFSRVLLAVVAKADANKAADIGKKTQAGPVSLDLTSPAVRTGYHGVVSA